MITRREDSSSLSTESGLSFAMFIFLMSELANEWMSEPVGPPGRMGGALLLGFVHFCGRFDG